MPTPAITPHSISTSSGERVRFNGRILGDVHLAENASLEAPNLEKITSTLFVSLGARLKAPKLKTATNIIVGNGAKIRFSALEAADGRVEIQTGALMTAPTLWTIAQNVCLNSSSRCNAPALHFIGGNLTLACVALLDAGALQEVTGGLILRPGAAGALPALTDVGYCDIGSDATCRAPKLARCGDLYFEKGGVLAGGELQSVGTVNLAAAAVVAMPSLATIQGDLGLGEGAIFVAPLLNQIEGDLLCGARSTFKTGLELVPFVDPDAIRGRRYIDSTATLESSAPASPSTKPRMKV